MIKQITNILICFVIALWITGCDKISELNQPSAHEVLTRYLDASLENRSEEAYGYISSEDQAVKSLSEYKSETKNKDDYFAEGFENKVSFRVLNVTEAGNTAKAHVELTVPDLESIFTDVIGIAFSSAFGGKEEAEIEDLLAKKYKNGEIPFTTESKEYDLLKETDGWKVFLDLKTKKAEKEKADKIATLLSDARDLRNSKKLHGAVNKYEEVLTLDSEMVDAKEGLTETRKEIEALEEKQAYIKNVVLKGFKVSEGTKYGFGEPESGVFGTIVNKGNRSLTKVEITVYFLDENGTVIGEEYFHPVLVTEYSFGNDNKPLKPNYVKDFGYSVEDSAPSSWSRKVRAKITNIEFGE